MLRKLLFALLLIPALAAPAGLSAQVGPFRGSAPNYELYGGYSYVFRPYDHTQTNPFSGGMNGWDASLRVPLPVFGSWLGIKGDVSGSYRNDSPVFNPHAYFFLAGPQVSLHLGRSTLFVHGLVGSAHLNQQVIPSLKSGSTFAMAAGGGLDVGVTRNLAWRITGDFYNTNFQSSDVTVKGIVNSNGRVSTGPVLRF
jgi:opacity protein-like surface antigen